MGYLYLLYVRESAGSSAARAGVLIGDKLLAVDNVNVIHASLETIKQLVSNGERV